MNNPTGNNLADKLLVAKVLNGDVQAFAQVVKSTEGLIAGIVFKMIPNSEDRKDVAQEVYLKTFHKLSGFKFQSKLSTWIAQIAYNACLSYLEKKKLVFPGIGFYGDDMDDGRLEYAANKSNIDAVVGAELLLSRKELSEIVRLAIQKLPPVYQTLITLYHQEDIGYEEMSQITGLPEGTVKSYLFRARRMLKEILLSKYKKEEL